MPIPEKVIIPALKDPGLGHFYISLIKSAVRIAGCVAALVTGNWIWLAAGFLAGELLGIVEELV